MILMLQNAQGLHDRCEQHQKYFLSIKYRNVIPSEMVKVPEERQT